MHRSKRQWHVLDPGKSQSGCIPHSRLCDTCPGSVKTQKLSIRTANALLVAVRNHTSRGLRFDTLGTPHEKYRTLNGGHVSRCDLETRKRLRIGHFHAGRYTSHRRLVLPAGGDQRIRLAWTSLCNRDFAHEPGCWRCCTNWHRMVARRGVQLVVLRRRPGLPGYRSWPALD